MRKGGKNREENKNGGEGRINIEEQEMTTVIKGRTMAEGGNIQVSGQIPDLVPGPEDAPTQPHDLDLTDHTEEEVNRMKK